MKHYELTNETTIAENGETLHRIRATRDIPSHNVTAGDLGGWLGDNAILNNNAWVCDEAQVYGNATATPE